MIRITDTVEKILSEDGFIVEAIQRGVLNLSAYAKEIHPLVEDLTMKPVRIGTIVVALTRIASQLSQQQTHNPIVTIYNFTITSHVTELTFERNAVTSKKLNELQTTQLTSGDFFTVTEGLHEITLICPDNISAAFLTHFEQKPKAVLRDLVAVSVRFPETYMEIPNTIYSLVGALAQRQINLIEIVSTYTELTFIVYREEMEKTIEALNRYAQRGKSLS